MTFKVTLSHSYVMERSRECFTFRFSDFYTTLITLASWKTFVLVLITPKNIIMCLCIILLRNFDSFKLRKYIKYHDPKNSIHIFLHYRWRQMVYIILCSGWVGKEGNIIYSLNIFSMLNSSEK